MEQAELRSRGTEGAHADSGFEVSGALEAAAEPFREEVMWGRSELGW